MREKECGAAGRASDSGEFALAGSCRLRSALAAVPTLSAHAAVIVTKIDVIFTRYVVD